MRCEIARRFPSFVSVAWLSDAEGDPAPLTPEEAALVHPRATDARKREFRLGRAAAHTALAGLDADSGPLGRGPHREPLWPPGIVGSITHAPSHAIAAVARRSQCGGLGIDLEHLERSIPELASSVAFDEELDWLATLDDDERRRAELVVFSAKETIFKAFFPRVGRFFGFEAARVRPRPDNRYEGRLVEALDADYPAARSLSIDVMWDGDLLLTSLVLEP